MNKRQGLFCGLLLSSISLTSGAAGPEVQPVLDKVSFQLDEKVWVETKTAKVIVSVNAVLNAKALSEARSKIMSQLKTVAPTDWHITTFDRNQDKSGLEKLYVVAETRVSSQQLANLNTKAKQQSTPGMTYQVQNIEFKPSAKEIAKAKDDLRRKLYAKVNEEISHLNKTFKEQHYTLNNLSFRQGNGGNMMAKANYARTTSLMASDTTNPIVVGNQISLSAYVTIAANRALA